MNCHLQQSSDLRGRMESFWHRCFKSRECVINHVMKWKARCMCSLTVNKINTNSVLRTTELAKRRFFFFDFPYCTERELELLLKLVASLADMTFYLVVYVHTTTVSAWHMTCWKWNRKHSEETQSSYARKKLFLNFIQVEDTPTESCPWQKNQMKLTDDVS
jgi:hypothetical protein